MTALLLLLSPILPSLSDQCVTGSSTQMSNVPKAVRTMLLHQPAEENGQICLFIHRSLFMSLSCWIFPQLSLSHASTPTPHPTSLLWCYVKLIFGGAPLSRAGFNSESKAMLVALIGPQGQDIISIMRHKLTLNHFFHPDPTQPWWLDQLPLGLRILPADHHFKNQNTFTKTKRKSLNWSRPRWLLLRRYGTQRYHDKWNESEAN